jgi:hypothetical protein
MLNMKHIISVLKEIITSITSSQAFVLLPMAKFVLSNDLVNTTTTYY